MSILQVLFGVTVALAVLGVLPFITRRHRTPAPPPARHPKPAVQPSQSPASPFGYDNGVIIARSEEDPL